MRLFLSFVAFLAVATSLPAATVDFVLQGNGGFGLLPTNENGTGAETSGSTASGGISPGGIQFDTETGQLDLNFQFSGLTGGLFEQAGGGIHVHGPAGFDNNAGIAFFLNNGSQANIVTTIAGDELSGSVSGFITLNAGQTTTLLNDEFYLNVHSDQFNGGELRANLVAVAVPEPGSMLVLGSFVCGAVIRHRRRSR